jgi:hypothetical protein
MKARRRNAKKSTRKPAGGRRMISGPAGRVSTGSYFKRPIFSTLCSSFSRNLVWTQLPTAGVSASAVLAFFTAAPVAAPVAALVAVELLLPMMAALN